MDIAAELALIQGKGADLKIGAKGVGKTGGSQVNPERQLIELRVVAHYVRH